MTLRIATPRFPSFPTRPESSPRRRSRRRALFRPRLDGLEDRALLSVQTLPGSTFEIDGNLTVDVAGNLDWANVPNPVKTADLPSGPTDNSFGQGTKEDTPVPTVVTGSIPNNKSDLTRFYVAQNKGTVNGQTDQFLYLAWERANTLGTANIDFELNQSTQISTNKVTPVRTIGDLLISFDFAQGGNTVNLTLRKWTGTAWGSPQSLSGAAIGAVNDVAFNYGSVNYANPIPDPLNNNAMLAPDTFGEAAIDLTAAGIFPATPTSCESFASAYVKSRSSASFTAELKDFIAPATVNVTNCADIIVKKVTNVPTTQTFTFNASGGSPYTPIQDPSTPGSFTLTSGQSKDFDVLPGTYNLAEIIPAGWVLQSVTGSPTTNVNWNGQTDATNLTGVTVSSEDKVYVTYTDASEGHIIVHKATSTYPGTDTTTEFTFTPSYNSGTTFQLVNGGSNDSGGLPAGMYTVNETVPSGWHLANLVVTPPTGGTSTGSTSGTQATVNLALGETVDVYYTDTKPALNLNVGISPIKENDQTYLTGTIHDLGGGGQAIQINWGDGSPLQVIPATSVVVDATGLATFNVVHKYLDNPTGIAVGGSFPIKVTVVDSPVAGPAVTTIANTSVVVNNVTPLPSAGTNATINEGDTLSRAGVFTDPGTLDTWTAKVDYGDGSGVQALALNPDRTFNLSHAYGATGTYIVTVYVSDGEAGPGPSLVGMTDVGTATFTVTANDVAPSLNAMSDLVVQAGTSFGFTEGISDPGFLDTFTYDVSWGDSTTDSTGSATIDQAGSAGVPTQGHVAASHAYATPGVYIVTVNVTDKDGKSSSTTFKVTVLGSLIS